MTRHRTAIALGACLLAAYAYFYQGGGWNQNSRFALVRAIIEEGTLRIDDTASFDGHRVTGDLAMYDGHLYSDKAPGLALVAVLPVALAYPFVGQPASREGIAVLSYLATVITAGLPGALTALLVFYLAGAFGATRAASLFAAAVFGLGSPAWCYATLFYGHALATACLMAAFCAAVALREPSNSRRDWLLASSVGVGGGWATVTEYPAAIPAAMIILLAIASTTSGNPRRLRRVVADVSVAALVCATVLIVFNQLSFGGPFHLSYSYEIGFEDVTEGFFGLRAPRRDVLLALLFGRFRGIFFLAPVLALAPLGFVLLIRDRRSTIPALTALAITVYYILFNASFNAWHGGWSFGPRYIAPALPLMSLALAPVWSRLTPALRACLCVLALYGVGITFVAVSTTAQPPDNVERPVSELLWPNFAEGHLAINWQAFVEGDLRSERNPAIHAWNVGEKLGLTGLASLAPLLAIWSVIGLAYSWRSRLWIRPLFLSRAVRLPRR